MSVDLKFDPMSLREALACGDFKVVKTWLINDILNVKHVINNACRDNRVDILNFLRNYPSKLDYDKQAMYIASEYGNIDVLDWWDNSGLQRKFNYDALQIAKVRGHNDVVAWWNNNNNLITTMARIKYPVLAQMNHYSLATDFTAFCESDLCELDTVKNIVRDFTQIDNDILRQAFVAACKRNNMPIIQYLYSSIIYAKYNYPMLTDATTNACQAGNMEVVDYVLQILNNNPVVVLRGVRAACEAGHLSIVKEIIETQPTVDYLQNVGDFLLLACLSSNLTLVEYLHSLFTSYVKNNIVFLFIKSLASEKLTIEIANYLYEIIKSYDTSTITRMIKVSYEKIKYDCKYSCLTNACILGSLDIVIWIKNNLGAFDYKTNQRDAYTAACIYGHSEIVQWFIDNKMSHPLKNYEFNIVCKYGRIIVIKILLKYHKHLLSHIDIHEALLTASDNDHIEVVELLLSFFNVDDVINIVKKYINSTKLIRAIISYFDIRELTVDEKYQDVIDELIQQVHLPFSKTKASLHDN